MSVPAFAQRPGTSCQNCQNSSTYQQQFKVSNAILRQRFLLELNKMDELKFESYFNFFSISANVRIRLQSIFLHTAGDLAQCCDLERVGFGGGKVRVFSCRGGPRRSIRIPSAALCGRQQYGRGGCQHMLLWRGGPCMLTLQHHLSHSAK